MTPETNQDATQKQPVRKKKAARACIHCQKAHLTCDDARPCQRCIKRGLSTTCADGARKKAKYLQDIDAATSPPTSQQTYHPESRLTIEAVDSTFGNPVTHNFIGSSPVNALQQSTATSHNGFMHNTTTPLAHIPLPPTSTSSPSSTPDASLVSSPHQHTSPSSVVNPSPITSFPPSIASSTIGSSQTSASGISTMSAYGDGAVVAKVASPVTSSTGATVKRRNQIITPIMAYSSVKHPFSYAEGYHYLVNYARQKMSQEDLMRISRALALFRPSVLASMMNLTTDDLIFTEKCLQRTLLEYEKLITYSGTPTVVWRRTGEIALVGKEFSLLTQWSKDALLNKKTYIYELMSNSSAVEYWEQYALHAFDNTDSAVYSSCILVSPTKRVVPCTFCFTIKRDIFDLPSVIVGNVNRKKKKTQSIKEKQDDTDDYIYSFFFCILVSTHLTITGPIL
ncbi:uncharacterized protein BX664DRAFT_268219 [Halteromyces radiatus]|uniref:uncharacterized protein n=1 Tax=Halteromyces radiatus TaxID=101107 RepID=UPI00221F69EC|nr:uncharacterized protein BX664DRAFT_268219 [Halteromyces radiatus]KAI8081735.1 hypothetical protein BX664DRAFT_268219 [Halteromyces radiatus]